MSDALAAGGTARLAVTAGARDAAILRRVQEVELQILRAFALRCEAEGLRWFAVGGTLLGAVRHRGFIPWDDDIDIGMPRPDFERLDAALRRSPEPGFTWESSRTTPDYPFLSAKLSRDGTQAREPSVAHLPIRHGIFIDVFPFDGAPTSRPARRAHGLVLKLAATALGARIRRSGVRRWLAIPFRAVPRGQALRLVDRLADAFPYDTSQWVVNGCGAWGYGRECQPRQRFEPLATLDFEGLRVPAPGGWDAYLSQVYGDYRQLPPEAQRRPRHALRVSAFSVGDDVAGSDPGDQSGQPSGSSPADPAPAGRRRRSLATAIGVVIVRLGFALGLVRPPARRVVLATRDASRVVGNLLAIRRELDRRELAVPVRVIGFRMRPGLRGRVVSAWEAFRVGYELAAARAFVADDWLFPLYATWPRRGATRVQVWHAAGAFKKFGFSVPASGQGGEGETDLGLPMTANWDLCLASSEAAIGPFAEAFRLPRERLTSSIGLPRTDAFFDPDHRAEVATAIRGRYGLAPADRLLLYAPTFRGERVRDARYDDSLELTRMRDALAGRGWRLLLRLHPLVRRAAAVGPELADFVVDVSDWPDMNELMFVADLLVTDYSSAVFEFALLDRPMAFFVPDLDEYVGERGFYLDVPGDLPGPAFRATEELAAYVAGGEFGTGAVGAFARRWFDVADGQASERFVDRVVLPALRGEVVRAASRHGS